VTIGDFLVIDAGTAHAIGRGLTLVEPQRVLPGCRGLTYRYWDWNRRYDAEGRADPRGQPRALHVEEALAVTRWDAPRGDALLASRRIRAGAPDVDADPTWTSLCGRDGGVHSDHLHVARVHGSGKLPLPAWSSLRSITVLAGSVAIGSVTIVRGQTAALPARLDDETATLVHAHAIIAAAY